MNNYKNTIKKINDRYLAERRDEAWVLFENTLEAENTSWKLPIAKKLAKNAHTQNLIVLLSINFCDLILIDYHRTQVFFISISSYKYAYDNNKAYIRWLEDNRKVFSEDISDDFGFKTRVLLVLNEENNSDSKNTNYKHDDFIITNPDRLGLSKIAGGPIPEDKASENSDIFEYCQLCANELTDIVFKVPQKEDNSVTNHSNMPTNFKLKDYAPGSYVQFIEENHKAIQGLEIKQILQLSMHFVLLDVDRNILKDVVSQFWHSIVDKNDSSDNVEIFFVNAAAQSIDEFKKNLKDKRKGIVVIKNLDAPVNTRVSTYSKQDQINELCNYMEQNNNNIIVLPLTQQNWKEFVAINSMLRILFQHSFVFEQLSVGTLEDYFLALLKNNNYSISKQGRELCIDFFNYSKTNLPQKAFTFTLATVLFREACYYHAIRTAKATKKDTYLQSPDIQEAIKDEYTPSNTERLSDVMNDLNQLVGLKNVKTSISDLAALIKIDRVRSAVKKKTSISLNVIFTGSPGTGKTTVAHMLGRIYKSIGALKSGHVVAVGRKDIVGQYFGDTERNMQDIIDKARGGVLFIDEAYSLYKVDSPRDFGLDAINVLVDNLEKIREHTCVILAGYSEPMAKFLTANEGLSSRFPNTLKFDDYSQPELCNIFRTFMNSENMQIEPLAEILLQEHINKIYEKRTKHFGNARECRNLFEKLKLIQARRLAMTDAVIKDLYLFKKEDMQALLDEKTAGTPSPKRQPIGFRTKRI